MRSPSLGPLQPLRPNHYAALGLDRHCTDAQIRDAYRLLAKQHHPDVNRGSHASIARTQQLNAAYEILGNPERRQAYDHELDALQKTTRPAFLPRRNLSQDIHLRVDEFFRGTRLEVRLDDPAGGGVTEVYPLIIPPGTAPGTRFRVPRTAGSAILVRVKMRPDPRFKPRGSDLRCDLRIRQDRAIQGGAELVRGATGNTVRVRIPAGTARGEIVRIDGEGLPKPRGGRGDLLVRILYQPKIRITRQRS